MDDIIEIYYDNLTDKLIFMKRDGTVLRTYIDLQETPGKSLTEYTISMADDNFSGLEGLMSTTLPILASQAAFFGLKDQYDKVKELRKIAVKYNDTSSYNDLYNYHKYRNDYNDVNSVHLMTMLQSIIREMDLAESTKDIFDKQYHSTEAKYKGGNTNSLFLQKAHNDFRKQANGRIAHLKYLRDNLKNILKERGYFNLESEDNFLKDTFPSLNKAFPLGVPFLWEQQSDQQMKEKSSRNDQPFSLIDIYETFPGVRAYHSSLDPFDPENTFSAEPFSQVKISPELIETMNLTSEQVLKLKDSALQMKLALELSGQSIESFSQDSDILNQNYAKLIIDSANLVNTLKVEQQQFKDDIALINHKDELLSLKDRYAELNADIPKGLQEWIDKLEKLENSAKDTGGKVQKTGEQFQRLRNSTKKTIPLAQQLAAEFTSVGHSLSNLSIIASSLNLPGAELFGITGSGALNIAAGLNNWNFLDTKDNVSFLDYAAVGSQIATSLLGTFDNLFGRFGLFGSGADNACNIPISIYMNNDMDVAPYNISNNTHYFHNSTLDRCNAAA